MVDHSMAVSLTRAVLVTGPVHHDMSSAVGGAARRRVCGVSGDGSGRSAMCDEHEIATGGVGVGPMSGGWVSIQMLGPGMLGMRASCA